MKFAYYPGCFPEGTSGECDRSTQEVARKLGIELVPLESAPCCGARMFNVVNPELNVALNARTLALAEREHLDLLTICSTCLFTLAQVNARLKQDGALLDKTNRILAANGLEYHGGVNVTHLLWVLVESVGLATLQEQVVRPLKGLRVAPFYGCHTVRPGALLGFEDPWTPSSLEKVIVAMGAEPVDYPGKIKCCGFHIVISDEEIALRIAAEQLQDAKNHGAHCLVTPCPLCHFVLDGYQPKVQRQRKSKIRLPVLHLAQLVGLAIGIEPENLQLSRHVISPNDMLRRLSAEWSNAR